MTERVLAFVCFLFITGRLEDAPELAMAGPGPGHDGFHYTGFSGRDISTGLGWLRTGYA